ncbi:MAG: hypothetical protein IT497_10890 [Ottowia sp.]|nr:hypothetical protein [Ottowia sp.]
MTEIAGNLLRSRNTLSHGAHNFYITIVHPGFYALALCLSPACCRCAARSGL